MIELLIATLAVAQASTERWDLIGDVPAKVCNSATPAPIATALPYWMKARGLTADEYALIVRSPEGLAELIADCGRNPSTISGVELGSTRFCTAINDFALRLNDLQRAPSRPSGQLQRSGGVLASEWVGTVAEDMIEDARLRREQVISLLENADSYQLACNLPAPVEAPDTDDGASVEWRLGANPDTIAQPALSVREFASFNLTDNRETNIEVSEINLAVGRAWTSADQQASALIYAALQRSESDDPKAEEDNLLQLGLRLGLNVDRSTIRRRCEGRSSECYQGLRHDHRLGMGIAYLSDDEFEAQGFQALMTFSPGLDLPGYRLYNRDLLATSLADRPSFQFAWLLDLTPLDLLSISERGEAFSATAEGYTRYGADLSILMTTRDELSWVTPTLRLDYDIREPFNPDQPSVSLFTAALILQPSKTSPVSFEVAYSDGEDLITLKPKEEVSLRLGVRF